MLATRRYSGSEAASTASTPSSARQEYQPSSGYTATRPKSAAGASRGIFKQNQTGQVKTVTNIDDADEALRGNINIIEEII